MKSTVYDFAHSPIVGALGDSTLEASFVRDFERAFSAKGLNAVCLPFQVAPRYLKNIVACMKLMDIMGLIVHRSHQKRIGPWLLGATEKLARDTGIVDMVVRQGNRFVGTCAWARTLLKLTDKGGKKPVMIVGGRPITEAASRVLKQRTFMARRLLTASCLAHFPREGFIIDFTASKIKDPRIITPGVFDSTSRDIIVELLLQSV